MAEEPDELDIEIDLSPGQAARPLTVGEFIEVMSATHNRITHISMAAGHLADGNTKDFVGLMLKSVDVVEEIGRTLALIAANKWTPRNDD